MSNSNDTSTSAATEERLAKIVADVLTGKTVMGAELGLEQNDLEAIYAVTYNVYNAGKYGEAMKLFGVLSLLDPADYRFVFGGASVYAALLPYCDTALITQVDAAVPGADAFFPALDTLPEWQLADAGEWQEEDGLRYRFTQWNKM